MEQITFTVADPGSADARWAMLQYFDELASRFEGGFVVGEALDEAAALYRAPTGTFVVASMDGQVVGCGAVVHLDAARAEIRRMWVSPTTRGAGLGRRLLGRLEDEVLSSGRTTVLLDTNRALTEAISMYEAAGYQQTERYNDNPYATHWFTKSLT